tara:strand:- start:4794 stop:5381 length:588 start_codon:yes stop_codon:yes gene_type:complete
MNKLARRIKTAREKKGMTRNDLSKEIGVSRAAISQWESGAITNLKARYLFPLAKALEVDPTELYWGTPSIPEQLRLTPLKFVPLLEYEEIGKKVEEDREVVPTTAESASYAVKISGDAMSPKFAPGCTVIFDADAVPVSGNCIIAEHTNRVFRQYHNEGGLVSLTPFNEKYPTIQMEKKKFKCLGVAVQKVENLN